MGIYETMETRGVKYLKGSKPKDNFKLWHKEIGSSFWALDYDLVLLEKVYLKNQEIIVPFAIIDYKTYDYQELCFSQICAYSFEKKKGKRVFIIEGGKEGKPTIKEPFLVFEYLSGKSIGLKKEVEIEFLAKCSTMDEFKKLERELRISFRTSFRMENNSQSKGNQ